MVTEADGCEQEIQENVSTTIFSYFSIHYFGAQDSVVG